MIHRSQLPSFRSKRPHIRICPSHIMSYAKVEIPSFSIFGFPRRSSLHFISVQTVVADQILLFRWSRQSVPPQRERVTSIGWTWRRPEVRRLRRVLSDREPRIHTHTVVRLPSGSVGRHRAIPSLRPRHGMIGLHLCLGVLVRTLGILVRAAFVISQLRSLGRFGG